MGRMVKPGKQAMPITITRNIARPARKPIQIQWPFLVSIAVESFCTTELKTGPPEICFSSGFNHRYCKIKSFANQ